MPRRLLLTDIDGTLLDDDGELPEANRGALSACHDSDVTVALATGRRWSTTRRLLDRLDLWPLVDYAILNNGMVVKDLRRLAILHSHAFPLSNMVAVAEILRAMEADPIILSHSPDGREPDVFYRALSLMNGDFVDKNSSQSRQVASLDELAGLDLVEMLLIGPHSDLRRAEAAIAHLPIETALIKNSFYKEWMLEITPRGISKFSGALYLQSLIGADSASTMAIGDSENDLPLLRSAQYAVAMAHAPETLKAMARHVASAHPGGGMGLAVMQWLSGQP